MFVLVARSFLSVCAAFKVVTLLVF